jgi:hypothetical protein
MYMVEGIIGRTVLSPENPLEETRREIRNSGDHTEYLGYAIVKGYALKQRTPKETAFSNAYDDNT